LQTKSEIRNPKSKVFVVVPSYNHAAFVERAVLSIIKQTFAPAKLLVIDDGSRDDSVRVIERVLGDCPFPAQLIARENRGLAATLNEAFRYSFGEYFAYLGSDDVWLPDFLASRVRVLDARPSAVLAFGHAFLINERDEIIDCTTDWVDYSDKSMLAELLRGIIPASPSVVYRRSALAKHSWNEQAVLEDYELYLKLSADGEFAFDAGEILCAWRQHASNTSGDFAKMLAEWLAAQQRVAPALGIAPHELTRLQTRLQFISVLQFLRQGEKRAAWRAFRANWRGAQSTAEIGKTLFRLLIPTQALAWHRRRKRRAATAKYGKLASPPRARIKR
jgi:alpha-1,3-rhamnosyltransferase